jgi:Pyruvate/2-oxoacid:ferredoxin oxidoreductase delta subunit
MPDSARGLVEIDAAECKGCGLCIEACPPRCLLFARELSPFGVHPAMFAGMGCTGCGICFYCCPEPGAITVYRAARPAVRPDGFLEVHHAGAL